jgi:uncharacterized protein YkwD
MHQSPPHRHPALRGGWTWTLAAFAALLALCLTLGSARPTQAAVVGNCTPGADWGAPSTSFAQEVLTLVNQHRASLGRTQLVISPTLTASASWKSLHMGYYRYMAHDDPAPPVARTTADRLQTCGYPIGSVGWGENIAYGYPTPQAVMTAWLNSSGHRANIENASYRAIGIGVARNASGTYYWTQNFGTLADAGSPPPPPPPPPPAAPTVTLASTPASSTTSTSASFSWTTTGSPTATTCSLDGATPTACTSPASYAGLALGGHTFVVRVLNSAGANSATYNWTVAVAAPKKPTVTITQKPRNRQTTATFAWTTTNSPTTVTCTLDGAPLASCSSPQTVTVGRGGHRFVVTVSNAAGSDSDSDTWFV